MEIAALFPGFRFAPTDVELISHYLKRKIQGLEQREEVIGEVDMCKFEPWDLPAKSIIPSDHEWFFFSPSGRKYPNGSQARRATEYGFWKATGKERFIRSGSNVIGTKRTLVFHIGRAPKGERTDWIMHEYCMKGHKVDKSQDSFVICRIRKKQEFTTEHDSEVVEGESNRDSPASAGVSAASQVGSKMQPLQMGAHRDGKLMECCLNKETSRLNSPVEPSDEPVLMQPNEGCSLEIETERAQDCHDKSVEDDCFADILNDDIVELDEISLAATPMQLPTVSDTSASERNPVQPVHPFTSQIHPFQGTAYRRIRLEMRRSGCSHTQTSIFREEGSMAEAIQQEARHYCIKSLKSKSSYCRKMSKIFIIIVALLFLFLQVVQGTRDLRMIKNFYP